MKITGIRTLVVNAAMRNWVFVQVRTDQPGLEALEGAWRDLEAAVVRRTHVSTFDFIARSARIAGKASASGLFVKGPWISNPG